MISFLDPDVTVVDVNPVDFYANSPIMKKPKRPVRKNIHTKVTTVTEYRKQYSKEK